MNCFEKLYSCAEKCGLSKEVLQSALINKGNNYRIKKFFDKAKAEEDVTVGFFGGSITFGSNAADGKSFSNRVTLWLKKLFPKSKISTVNGGFGGTGSIVGFYRMNEDLICYNPDLVFIDFTVNDALEYERDGVVAKESYEGIIRALLRSGAAVVVLCFCDEKRTTFRDLHLEIAKHYDLPVVSMVDSIYKLVETGKLKWADYSNDSVHPVNLGHEMISYIIENYILYELNANNDCPYVLPDSIYKCVFEKPHTYDYFNLPSVSHGSFKKYDGYSRLKNGFISSGSQPLVFDLSGAKELFLIVLYCNDPNTGTAVVEINGEKQNINFYFKDGWGSKPLAVNVFTSDVPKDLSVRIYPESDQKNIIILRVCKS